MQAQAISMPYDFPDALVVGILISLHRNNLGWYCSQSHSILFEGCGVFADLIFGSEMQTVAFVNVSSNRIARGCNLYGHKVGPSSSTNSVCSQVQFLLALATFHSTSSQPSNPLERTLQVKRQSWLLLRLWNGVHLQYCCLGWGWTSSALQLCVYFVQFLVFLL